MMSMYVYNRARNGHIVIGSFISTVMRFSICDTDKRKQSHLALFSLAYH